jgi:hypothetical protein
VTLTGFAIHLANSAYVTPGATFAPDPATPGAYDLRATFVTRGQWYLLLDLQGPSGAAQARVLETVAGPPPIPFWLGWLIGLIPLWGLIAFLCWQVRARGRQWAAQVPEPRFIPW